MQIKFNNPEINVVFSLKSLLWKEKEKVFTAIAIVLLGAFFLAKSISGKEKLIGDFFESGLFQSRIKAGKDVSEKELELLIKKHAELKPLFLSHLEQSYVLKNNTTSARKVAEDSIARLSFIPGDYINFARNSLLIEEGKYEDALLSARDLKEKLSKDKASNFYGLNLVRIAFLEDLLQKEVSSLNKWSEVKSAISNELYLHLSDEGISFFSR